VLGWVVLQRTVAAAVVRFMVGLCDFDAALRASWSGAASAVSVLHSAFERTKFRHLNRPQCKVLPF